MAIPTRYLATRNESVIPSNSIRGLAGKFPSNSNSSSKGFLDSIKDTIQVGMQPFNIMKKTASINRIAQLNGKDPPFDPRDNPGIQGTIFRGLDKANDAFSSFIEPGVKAVEGLVNNVHTPSSGASAKPIIYSDWSPSAKFFGMDQETAYAEHMANTAHQREVNDLRSAGLNPVLGAGSGATMVSGSIANTSSSAKKVSDNGLLDVIGATASVVTALLTKNPMQGMLVGKAVTSLENLND